MTVANRSLLYRVGGRPIAMFTTVLFPISPGRETLEALPTVTRLIQHCQSRLVILAVAEAPEQETEAANLLASIQQSLTEGGITSEPLQRTGKPAFVICDVADELGADLIVMGCRGLGLTQEGTADSVSVRVINLAPCPVLVIP